MGIGETGPVTDAKPQAHADDTLPRELKAFNEALTGSAIAEDADSTQSSSNTQNSLHNPLGAGMEPQSLRGSMSRNPEVTSDAALELEIGSIQKWLNADPSTPPDDHLRSELQDLQIENSRRKHQAGQNGKDAPDQKSAPAGRVSFQVGIQISAETKDDGTTDVIEYHLDPEGSSIVWTPEGSKVPALQLNRDKSAWEPAKFEGSSYTVEPKESSGAQRFANRVSAGVGIVFDTLEAYAGGLIIAGSDGLGTAPGWALAVDASDRAAAHGRQLFSGETEHTLLYKGVKALTGSNTAAAYADMAVPILIAGIPTRGPALPKPTPPPSGPAIVKLSNGWRV